jgi:phosphatidylglycerol:prolipoprotein diacylglycerol transferase
MVAFHIGPLSIAYYGIMITLGVIAAVTVAYLEARRYGDDTRHVYNLVLVVLPLGAIGARMYHVIDQWSYYSQHPAQIFGGAGLGIFGAVIGGAIGVIIYTRWKNLSTLHWLDIAAPGVILAQAIGRWGNYFNQELYGYPTTLPWGIYIDPAHRLPGYEGYSYFHPLFFYEFTWDLLGCVFLLFAGRKWRGRLLNGDIFFLYAIWYGLGRFYLEGLKINVWTLGGVPTARWISGFAIVAAALIIFIRHRRRKTPPGPEKATDRE